MNWESVREGVVRYERRGHVARVVLNRSEAMNAVDRELSIAFGEIVEQIESDAEIRVIVLSGAGRAFCVGQDLKALAAGEPVGLPDFPSRGFAGFIRNRIDIPVIAAVHGVAFGGGCEIALAADIVVAAESARFGLPEVKLALFAAGGGVPRLAQAIPAKLAAYHLFTGEPISASDAARYGLVSLLVPDDELEERAVDVAERIAANGPLGVRTTKRILRDHAFSDTWTQPFWSAIQDDMDLVFDSEDGAEGVSAFVQKRPPVYTGR